jgi:hypothetical protein
MQMATKKSTKRAPKAAEAAEAQDDIQFERPITTANHISDKINRQLTQLKGICALIGAADMNRELFDNDDLQAAMWGVQDLVESIESQYEEFYEIVLGTAEERAATVLAREGKVAANG